LIIIRFIFLNRNASHCMTSSSALHDALPISPSLRRAETPLPTVPVPVTAGHLSAQKGEAQGLPFIPSDTMRHRPSRGGRGPLHGDRKSTRLNSSHVSISYSVFRMKRKTTNKE